MKLLLKSLAILVLFTSTNILAEEEQPKRVGYSVIYSIQDETWKDVNEAVKEAITGQGIVISYTSHAKSLLDRTADAVGTTHVTYLGAQIHLFCSSAASHRMVKVNPHIIAGCPYGIAVYELTTKPGTIYVSYRENPAKEAAYKEVSKLQDTIIREALDL